MISRKGVEITLQTIVVAALVLVVLIILIVIFTRSSAIFGKDIGSCTSKKGECKENCGPGEFSISMSECSGTKSRCCINLSMNTT